MLKTEEGINRRGFIGVMSCAAISAVLSPKDLLADTRWVDSWGRDNDGAAFPIVETPPAANGQIAGEYCEGRLRLKSAIHGGTQEFRFRDDKGNYDPESIAALNWFLRCRDNTWQYMDPRLVESLNYLSKLLGDPVIQVNSGYRSPVYNAKLAGRNENAARNSLHQYGQAVDFAIPGMSVRDVCSYAIYARNLMGYGGIGYYPVSGFVHLDSGKIKEWSR